jgi:mycofactocin system glycosyltransferase
VEPGWAEALLGHLVDPCVGAVAPRVAALRSAGIVAGYEQRHSPLDMGAGRGLVGPGRPTPYVPSAVLVGRREALGEGFDESLVIGEDVDLVWRMAAAGWRVVYEPGAQVRHDHRLRLRAFAARRRLYARSVAILARRHPEALPAARVSPWMAVPWALALAGRRRAAIGAAAVDAVLLGRRLRAVPDGSYRLAGGMIARGLLHTGFGLAQAVRRAWAPPLAVLAWRRRGMRRLLLAAVAARIVEDALATRDPRAVAGDVPMRLLDEAIALAGTWEGCLRERTVRPLLLTWRMTGRARQDAPMPTAHVKSR